MLYNARKNACSWLVMPFPLSFRICCSNEMTAVVSETLKGITLVNKKYSDPRVLCREMFIYRDLEEWKGEREEGS